MANRYVLTTSEKTLALAKIEEMLERTPDDPQSHFRLADGLQLT